MGFGLEPTTIEYVAIFFVALSVILLYLAIHRVREKFKGRLLKVLSKISPWGIEPLNKLLHAAIIDNWIGKDSIGRVLREILSDLNGDGLVKMLRRVGWKVVKNVFLKNTEDREQIRKLLSFADAQAELEGAELEEPTDEEEEDDE